MSLYVGKNSAAGSPLIITSGTHSLAEMTSSTLPSDTIFSTSLSFLEAEVFSLTNIKNINNNYYSKVVTGMLDPTAINYIYTRLLSPTTIPVILYAVDNKIVSGFTRVFNASTYIWDFIDTGSLPNSVYVGHTRPFPTSVHKYKAIQYNASASSIKVIVLSLNIAKDGSYISNSSGTVFDTSNSVFVNSSSFVVNGVNLASLKYVTLKNINAGLQLSGNSAGSLLSIPNLNLPTTKCELVANSTRVYIKNSNNEFLFDSSIGAIHYDSSFIAALTLLPSVGSVTRFYVNNYVVPASGGIITSFLFPQYYAYLGSSIQVAMSNFYIFSATKTVLYALSVTASGTTYEYSMYVGLVNNVRRLILEVTLVRMGADGNPGFPPMPYIKAIATIK